MSWTIVRVETVSSYSNRDTVEAARVHLEQGDERRGVIVELSGSAAASGITLNAPRAVHPYLNDHEPPRQVIVTPRGVGPGGQQLRVSFRR